MPTSNSNYSTVAVNGSVVDFTSSSSTNSTPLPSSTNLNTDKSSVKQKFLENRRLQGFLQDAGDKRSAERSVLGLGRDGMEMERERARGLDTGEMRKVMGEELRGWGRWFEDAGRRESR